MPTLLGKKYIIQGQCLLATWPEFCRLATETATTLGDCMFQDLICQWGTLYKVVTDNSKLFIKVLTYLSKHYHINHICILGYNSWANGIAEQSHFDVWQSLIKAADGVEVKWFQVLYSVFWAECITICKCLRVSPYFIVTGTQPLIPLNIIEATYLNLPPCKSGARPGWPSLMCLDITYV